MAHCAKGHNLVTSLGLQEFFHRRLPPRRYAPLTPRSLLPASGSNQMPAPAPATPCALGHAFADALKAAPCTSSVPSFT
jgi:hypothetical protein